MNTVFFRGPSVRALGGIACIEKISGFGQAFVGYISSGYLGDSIQNSHTNVKYRVVAVLIA